MPLGLAARGCPGMRGHNEDGEAEGGARAEARRKGESWEVLWAGAGPETCRLGIPGRNGLSPKFGGGRKRVY